VSAADIVKAVNDRAGQLTLPVLAIVVSIGFFALLGLLFFHAIPKENHDAAMLCLGSLGTGWVTIIAYYFGSSMSSRVKDETIKKIADAAGQGGPNV